MKTNILPAPGEARIISDRATTNDVALAMRQVIHECSQDYHVKCLANMMIGADLRETVENFCYFVYKCAYFMPDCPSSQTIRTPRRLIADGEGNCVDYTVTLGALAKAANLPVTLRLVRLPGQQHYGHVYPVIAGIIADVVPGQAQDGSERFTRQPGKLPLVGVTGPELDVKDYYL